MDEGDIDFSTPDFSTTPPTSCSMESFFDEILQDTSQHACTHTHTCNPPIQNLSSHTHTCFHVHTKILSQNSDSDDKTPNTNSNISKKRPCGNREAVRKYREKKKAHAASLEDEVVQLRAVNQQLLKKLQSQAHLEAEVARLRCLLVDIRGRIDGEIGSFPYKNQELGGPNGGVYVNSCDFRCDDQLYCPRQGGKTAIAPNSNNNSNSNNNNGFGGCEVGNVQCMGNGSGMVNGSGFGCSPNPEQK